MGKRTLSAALMAALALSGCAVHHAPPPRRAVSGGPHYGGTLTITGDTDPKTLNLWLADESNSDAVVGPLFEGLERQNPQTLLWEARLAAPPKVSADGLTWTYRLKPGLQWSDGQPLNADDVCFTLDMLLDPKTQGPLRESLLVDVPQPGGGPKREPFAYRALNDRTIQFHLPARCAVAHSLFSFPIAPRHALEAVYKAGRFNTTWGIDTPVSQIVTSGPWVISEYVPSQRIVYTPNPHFFRHDAQGRQLPYLSRFNYLVTADPNAGALNFRAGTSDMIPSLSPTDYPEFKRGEAAGDYKVYERGLGYRLQYLDFNQNPDSKIDRSLLHLFQDARFRQAVSYAIDRPRLCRDVYQGLAQPLYGPVTPADTLFYDPQTRQYPFDLAKAKALLTQIGLKPNSDGLLAAQGVPVKFTLAVPVNRPQWISAGTIITNDLRQIGLDVTLTPLDLNNELQRLDGPPYDWQAVLMGFGVGVDPNSNVALWRSSGRDHEWHPSEKTPATPWEAQVDALFSQAAVEPNPAKRKALYDRWQKIMGEQQPFLFTVVQDQYSIVRSHFGNIKTCALAGPTWNLEEIYDTDTKP